MQLSTFVYEQEFSTVLGLVGPVTRHSLPAVEECLIDVLAPIGCRLVLDLGMVSECDSAGAAALLGVWRMSRDRAGEAVFAQPAPAVRSWLQLAAFADVAVYRTVEGADRADDDERIDPMTAVAPVPTPRRGVRPRTPHGTRPGNAAHAVYARPGAASAWRNRPAR